VPWVSGSRVVPSNVCTRLCSRIGSGRGIRADQNQNQNQGGRGQRQAAGREIIFDEIWRWRDLRKDFPNNRDEYGTIMRFRQCHCESVLEMMADGGKQAFRDGIWLDFINHRLARTSPSQQKPCLLALRQSVFRQTYCNIRLCPSFTLYILQLQHCCTLYRATASPRQVSYFLVKVPKRTCQRY
jgi:hypothetical protein